MWKKVDGVYTILRHADVNFAESIEEVRHEETFISSSNAISIETTSSMDKDGNKKYDPFIDSAEPVYIDNFLHLRSAVCRELLGEASEFLKENGWEHDFGMYYHDTKEKVRLYLRLAYVGSLFLDGTWEEIKCQIPSVVPLAKALIELRKYKTIGLKWIESNLKLLEWTNVKKLSKG